MIRKKQVKKKANVYDKIRPYVYMSPALITMTLLSFLPIVYTIYIAFTNQNINHLYDYHFVGLQNFRDILTGPFKAIFLPVFSWTLICAVISTLGCYIIGLIFALVLNNPNMKESVIYKGLLIIPWALPATIATLTWQGLLNETYGAINVALQAMHIISKPVQWFSEPLAARSGIIMANLWLGFPYMMNICIGALSAIPDTYYEAADIDGATKWQKFTKITLPSITSTSLPLLISSFAFNFNNFGTAYLIMNGGPAKVGSQYAGYTDILISSTYKLAMQYNMYNIGSALAILIFILIGTISAINLKMTGAFKEV